MPKNLDQSGVLQVNGAWATSLKYESEVFGARAGVVDLRFMQGRSDIARAFLLTEEVAEVIGEKNAARISRHLAGDADKYLAVIKGELRGSRLEYKEVKLEENAILRGPEPTKATQTSKSELRDDSTASSIGPGDKDADTKRPPAVYPVPQQITAKYLIKHDKYYFDDQTVAFIDRGSRLSVQTQNSAVIKDLVEIAKSRDWQAVSVSGTKAFRRDVWKEASAAGLSVSGYSPTALEQEAADKARLGRTEYKQEHEPDLSFERQQPRREIPGASAASHSMKQAAAARGVLFGTLLDHGEAPYRHDPSKSKSYFVTIQDASGVTRTHWGVGLAAAVRQAQTLPQIGEEVGLRRVGSIPVTIVERTGGEGKNSTLPIATKRHQWQIEKTAYFKQNENQTNPPRKNQEEQRMAEGGRGDRTNELTPREEVAAAIRSARTTREDLQLKYPDLNRAVFQHLASHDQFAEAYVKAGLIREADRAQVIAQMRERLAGQVERGNTLKETNDKQVNTLIRRSVERVAADIGRPVIEVTRRASALKPPVRDEMQVRG